MENLTIIKLKELLCKRDGLWNERLRWEIEKRKNQNLDELIEKVENGEGDEMDKDNLYMVYGKDLKIKFLENIDDIDKEIGEILKALSN